MIQFNSISSLVADSVTGNKSITANSNYGRAFMVDAISSITKNANTNDYTLTNSITKKIDSLNKLAKDSTPMIEGQGSKINDAYGNSLLGIGSDDVTGGFTNYGLSNDTLNFMLWKTLYSDSWVFRRAIDKPAQDQVNAWFTLKGSDERYEQVYSAVRKCKKQLIEILMWGALYGGSIGIMLFDGISYNDMKKPLRINSLKPETRMKIYAVDRWYGVSPSPDIVNDMKSLDYGMPKSYDITFPDGKTYKVHHSFVLRYEHRTAPQLIKRGQLQGWGYAEGAHIVNELMRDDKIKASIQSLIDKSLIEVIKMSGMRGVFMGADVDNENQLRKRLEMVNWGRNFNSLTFLDSEDEYQQNTFNGLSGLADLLQQNMWMISAALEMQGILFGDMKSGFSVDVDALERYDQTIRNRNESYYEPVLEKLLTVLFRKFQITTPLDFEFNSLLKKQQDERKMDNLEKFITINKDLMESGLMTVKQAASSIDSYSKTGTIDFKYDDKLIAELESNFEQEMENVDLGNEVEEEEFFGTDSKKKKGKR